jgi:D-inositol-3-phosphate glycosyltransferase
VIEALAILRKQQPDLLRRLRFMIVGGKPADPADGDLVRLAGLVRSLELGEVIQFVGAKDQTELPDYYAAATAVVVPSDYESFGMVALEAMASGTPVIATEVGGLAFLVKDGETGFLVPTREPEALAHRIALLLNDFVKLEEMRTAAHLLAQQYTWSTIADELLKLFVEVVSGRDLSPHKR